MNDRIGIGFTSQIVPVKPINDQLTLCKCYVMAIGKNNNKSNISKEAVDNALPSLFNIPVVGHLYVDENGEYRMGGHDMALARNEDGSYKFNVLTVPFGVVPVQEGVHYETVVEASGAENNYLVADIILWTGRYPELLNAVYSDKTWFAQSMEIIPLETKHEDGYVDIDSFQYSALCLLGKSDDPSKNVQPCFDSARVEPYFSANGECTKLFEEFKEELAKCYERYNFGKGGKEKLNKELIEKILAMFNLQELPFEISENETEDSLKERLEEFTKAKKAEDSVEENPEEVEKVEEKEEAPALEEEIKEDESVKEEPQSPIRFQIDPTYEEIRQKLNEKLEAAGEWTETSYKNYRLCDFDTKFAYVLYHQEGAGIETIRKTFRLPYVVVSDAVEIDFNGIEEVRLAWITKEDEEKISQKEAEFAALTEYKAAKLAEEQRQAYSAVIAQFSDLEELDDYKQIVKEALSFESSEALAEKLYALRGRTMKKPQKKQIEDIKIPVGFASEKQTKAEEEAEFMNRFLPQEQK